MSDALSKDELIELLRVERDALEVKLAEVERERDDFRAGLIARSEEVAQLRVKLASALRRSWTVD